MEITLSFHLNLFPLSLFLSSIPNVCSSQKLGFFLSLIPLQNLTTKTKDVIFPKICPTLDIFFGWVSFYTFSFRFLAISPLRCYVSISYLYIYTDSVASTTSTTATTEPPEEAEETPQTKLESEKPAPVSSRPLTPPSFGPAYSNFQVDSFKLMELLGPEKVDTADVKLIKDKLFGYSTFWVTKEEPFGDLDEGVLFVGNLRGNREEVFAKL
ncbi:probable zinc metalloprotease EGY1, chloroplastic [Humulus lupulus]|uniref:probable zinc metalloprotease EGY1, chloroplastic n=1 Tax=Humulus lupulus TaxID=3486 RepID=UPI002B407299|nr:probable zinc metalloprotease EGY1, chloroplastic [Humulus lupulus]